jgi:hypothetical protein
LIAKGPLAIQLSISQKYISSSNSYLLAENAKDHAANSRPTNEYLLQGMSIK